MVGVADFREIYEYNWRVLRDYGEALAKLPEDEVLKNREATHESLKNIFHHILSVHDGWLNVTAQGASADPVMREKDFDEVRSMEPLRGYLEKIIARRSGSSPSSPTRISTAACSRSGRPARIPCVTRSCR